MTTGKNNAVIGNGRLLRPDERLPVLEIVGRSKSGRKLAIALGVMLLALPALLIFVPWQQNVPGAGRVTALDPLDRIQIIPAPVTGRLTKLNVQEGSRVEKGEILAEMADLDPDYTLRLDEQAVFAQNTVDYAHETLERLDDQLISLEEALLDALRAARSEFKSAAEKVKEAEQKLEEAVTKLGFDERDAQRQKELFKDGLSSEKDMQKAVAVFGQSQAKVEQARAAIAQAVNERDAKAAKIDEIDNKQRAYIDEVLGKQQEAKQKLESAKKELTERQSAVARQSTQVIESPRSGTVLRAAGANSADLITRGDPLMEIVPDTAQISVEMWMRGIDAPLVEPGRKARIQFEGWPAVQFAGWPSVAVGTFGGIVRQVDAQAASDGRVRVMIVPDPDEDPWPKQRFLRQGVRANGWVQLDTVSSGYEIWRQLNAFPPSVQTAPTDSEAKTNGAGKKAAKAYGAKGKGK